MVFLTFRPDSEQKWGILKYLSAEFFAEMLESDQGHVTRVNVGSNDTCQWYLRSKIGVWQTPTSKTVPHACRVVSITLHAYESMRNDLYLILVNDVNYVDDVNYIHYINYIHYVRYVLYVNASGDEYSMIFYKWWYWCNSMIKINGEWCKKPLYD